MKDELKEERLVRVSEEYSKDLESKNRLAQDMAGWRLSDFPIVELQREIYKSDEANEDKEPEKSEQLGALGLKNRMETGVKRKNLEPNKDSQVCKEMRDRIDSELKTIPVFNSAAWKREIKNESLEEWIKRNNLELEKGNEKLDKKEESNALELEDKNSDFVQSLDIGDENKVAENTVPLMTEETVRIDLSEYEDNTSPAHRPITQTHFYNNWDIKKLMEILLVVIIPSSVCIAIITIGSLYINDCPAQPYIPIYLVVGGACFLTLIIYKDSTEKYVVCFLYMLNVFQLIWLIVGCVWVYSAKEVEFDDTTKDIYCHKTLYYFAFWLLNISLGLVVIPLMCCCLCTACVSAYKKMKRPTLPPGYAFTSEFNFNF